ncbi:MAG: MerR family transcriptional regulator [Thermoleophilia bacterium]|nr:MerR family transcriptional regulator [Thermoleophilia bacterium]
MATRSEEKPLTIGAVCKELKSEFNDVSISKIRYLEEQKLLNPLRTQGGYRLYRREDIERLRTILQLQRDEFLPLKVIRQEIEGSGTVARSRERKARRSMRTEVAVDARRVDRSELLRETGLDDVAFIELQSYGIVTSDQDGLYGESEVEIIKICQRMAEFGLGPRHVRQLYTGVQRVAGLLDQVLAPALRSRNTERREQGLDELAQLAGLSAELTERLLVRDVKT